MHRYSGDGVHDFNESILKCKYCGHYLDMPHVIYHEIENIDGVQTIYLPFCSEKCFIDSGSAESHRYQNIVEHFMTQGGIQEWEVQREREAEEFKLQEERRTLEKAQQEMVLRQQRQRRLLMYILLWVSFIAFAIYWSKKFI